MVARLTHADALAADNRAVALLPRRERQPVLLVTEPNLFLEQVFKAIPVVDLAVTATPPESVPPGTIAVFHRQTPESVPAGQVLVIDPARSTDVWTVGEPLENPIVTKQDADSPLMTHVRLDNVLMPEARRLSFSGTHQVLAGSIGEEPIYVAVDRRQRGKLLVLTANLDKGDLPLRTAFPILMTNAISWFQGDKGELREALATGRTLEVDLESLVQSGGAGAVSASSAATGADVEPLVLREPGGPTRPLPSGVTKTTIGPLDQCGVWSIERQGEAQNISQNPSPGDAGPKLEIACNLANRIESDLRRPELTSSPVQADLLGIGGRPIWFYLTLAALILIALEWYLSQRRWIS
jgi:hypothetical protein